ncbi:ABC-2 family transporter [Tumebacillus sp. BK434]|uniref:ABC transporter permease n=1 Tax=Tumebacillus sp. BK434 TaxID=2512169 RepID=UPI0010D96F41|nr:ABC transporter permease [Tumebacillus sp. BK434]TCP53939.1 ABC-2 family transporter [Tumebacillus sp. BK434]
MWAVWQAEAYKYFKTKLWWGTMLLLAVPPLLNLMMWIEFMNRDPKFELTFAQAGQENVFLIAILFGPLVICLLSTLSITSETQNGTLRYVLTSQIKRWQLIFGKALWVLTWNSLLLLFAFLLNLGFAALLGASGTIPFTDTLLSWLVLSASLAAMIPVYLLMSLLIPNFFVPVGFALVGTFLGLILSSSKYVAVYPFTSPAVFLMLLQGRPMEEAVGTLPLWIGLVCALGLGGMALAAVLFQRKDVAH